MLTSFNGGVVKTIKAVPPIRLDAYFVAIVVLNGSASG
ncbi:hypothetical protein SeV_A1160 [Salmonella enterica subsp. enterica serovar Virchow str. SL491]|uniref:Uncharacterized protein n=1 Tax=Salmonella virchow (strain SL491) TaxID=465517 RepID=A0A6C8ES61_SALV4|nr:hypothetical protein SeV_A1160 [Salmonella enterica subsp. enterica serovar Virchow str. SL491]